MERLTFEGNFCDISRCTAVPCPSGGNCSQKQVWARLKEWEDTGLTPETIDVLKKHSKMLSELCDGIGTLRVKELVEADKDGRVLITKKSDDGTCGSCDHFKRIAGTRSGTCDIKPYCSNRYGQIDKSRGTFSPAQSRKACKQYSRKNCICKMDGGVIGG